MYVLILHAPPFQLLRSDNSDGDSLEGLAQIMLLACIDINKITSFPSGRRIGSNVHPQLALISRSASVKRLQEHRSPPQALLQRVSRWVWLSQDLPLQEVVSRPCTMQRRARLLQVQVDLASRLLA